MWLLKKHKISMWLTLFPLDGTNLDKGLKAKASFKMHCVAIHGPHFWVLLSI